VSGQAKMKKNICDDEVSEAPWWAFMLWGVGNWLCDIGFLLLGFASKYIKGVLK